MTLYWRGSDCYLNVDECDLLSALHDMNEARKAQHRVKMVAFRMKKKRKRTDMKRELERLEHKMKVFATKVRNAATPSSVDASNCGSRTFEELSELLVERETLQSQNLALRKRIGKYEKFAKMFTLAGANVEKEERVEIGTPVHCHSLIRAVFDAQMERFDLELANSIPSLSALGSFIGWKVLRAPLISLSISKKILVCAQITKRLPCSFDVQRQMAYTKRKELGAVLLTPGGRNLKQTTEVLHEFDQNSTVLMHNISGPGTTLQYFFHVRHVDRKLDDGRRKMTVTIVITNVDVDRQGSVPECSCNDPERATSEKFQLTVTEFDNDSVDISCDHWANCANKLLAEHLMNHWMQFSLWWEQLTVSSNLL